MSEDQLIKKLAQIVKGELRPIKEIVEILKNKVSKSELFQGVVVGQVKLIREQQSVMNEKLDGISTDVTGLDVKVIELNSEIKELKADVKKLNEKADGILDFAEAVDETTESTAKRLSKIERIPIIAASLK